MSTQGPLGRDEASRMGACFSQALGATVLWSHAGGKFGMGGVHGIQ